MPAAASVSHATPSATAPTTFGEPASWRSGRSAHTVSSIVTTLTAPPPRRNGSPAAEPVALADEGAGPVRRVQLVPGQREVVDPVALHVDRRMGRQLRRVDQQPRAVLVRHARDLGERPDLAGHVAGAGGRDEVRVLAVGKVAERGLELRPASPPGVSGTGR